VLNSTALNNTNKCINQSDNKLPQLAGDRCIMTDGGVTPSAEANCK